MVGLTAFTTKNNVERKKVYVFFIFLDYIFSEAFFLFFLDKFFF